MTYDVDVLSACCDDPGAAGSDGVGAYYGAGIMYAAGSSVDPDGDVEGL